MKKVTNPGNQSGIIKFPQLTWAKLSQLNIPDLNRDMIDSHIRTMEATIREHGFADVIKVFPLNQNGLYTIAESSHRVASLRVIFKDKDPYVPIAILNWVDSDDIEEIQKQIINLNTVGKSWTIYDYVKSHAAVPDKYRKNARLFREIRDTMKTLNPILTNGLVAGIYSKQIMKHTPLQDGTLEITPMDRLYVDKFLDRIPKFKNNAKGQIPYPFLRRLIFYSWQIKDKFLTLNNLPDFNSWNKFLDYTIDQAETMLSFGGNLPDGDDSFLDWWKKVCTKQGVTWIGKYTSNKGWNKNYSATV